MNKTTIHYVVASNGHCLCDSTTGVTTTFTERQAIQARDHLFRNGITAEIIELNY